MITKAKDFLGKEVEVVIDRPLGSKHPEHGFPNASIFQVWLQLSHTRYV